MADTGSSAIETTTIKVSPEFEFTADVSGPVGAPLVICLHGFPESRNTWRPLLQSLGAAGYRVVAFDQRGYSAGARPDPTDLDNYAYAKLISDVIAVADASGYVNQSFHVVSHDWGGQIGWGVADKFPERVASLSVLSRPHPSSFRRALLEDHDQKFRSRHHKSFLEPETGPSLLANGAARLRELLGSQGVPKETVERHLAILGTSPAIEATLAWYRSNKGLFAELGTITVPTLYIWGDVDSSVGRLAAEGTREFVRSDCYTFEVLPGVGHFVIDQEPGNVLQLIRELIGRTGDRAGTKGSL
jgi:pimeloyl-ACP methyl ester carboxylesterase